MAKGRERYVIRLEREERDELERPARAGRRPVRKIAWARILLKGSAGYEGLPDVSDVPSLGRRPEVTASQQTLQAEAAQIGKTVADFRNPEFSYRPSLSGETTGQQSPAPENVYNQSPAIKALVDLLEDPDIGSDKRELDKLVASVVQAWHQLNRRARR